MEQYIISHLTYPQFKKVKEQLGKERIEFTTLLNTVIFSPDNTVQLDAVKQFCQELDETIRIRIKKEL